MSRILVTSYNNPDLDGTACAIGYAEWLRGSGEPAIAGLFGKIHPEAEHLFERFQLERPVQAEEVLESGQPVVLVDASYARAIMPPMTVDQVIEVIDHRQMAEPEAFPNAHVQVEFVGAAATLITEKFIQHNQALSRRSALLLYGAIISNTINFQNNVTTDRDRTAAQWLKSQTGIPSNFTEQMFAAKSHITDIEKAIEQDLVIVEIADSCLALAQLELLRAEQFVQDYKAELLQCLKCIQQQRQTDFAYLSCIDLSRPQNIFLTLDPSTEKLLYQILKLKFSDQVAIHQGILMRKEVMPMLRLALTKNSPPSSQK